MFQSDKWPFTPTRLSEIVDSETLAVVEAGCSSRLGRAMGVRESAPICENQVIHEVTSPDGAMKAVLFRIIHKEKLDAEVQKVMDAARAKIDRLTQRHKIKQMKIEASFWENADVIIARTRRDALHDEHNAAFQEADTALVAKV